LREMHANAVRPMSCCLPKSTDRASRLKRVIKEPQFNPDVVRAVEEKLRALSVDDEPPASVPGAT
jgi:hypothetical protein